LLASEYLKAEKIMKFNPASLKSAISAKQANRAACFERRSFVRPRPVKGADARLKIKIATAKFVPLGK